MFVQESIGRDCGDSYGVSGLGYFYSVGTAVNILMPDMLKKIERDQSESENNFNHTGKYFPSWQIKMT